MLTLFSSLVLSLAAADALAHNGARDVNNGNGALSLPLVRRKQVDPRSLPPDEFIKFARARRHRIAAKYARNGAKSTIVESDNEKRASSGGFGLVNQNSDVSYYGLMQAGTPPTDYPIVLDTGSSDLWLASSTCLQGCSGVPKPYDASKSSTSKTNNQPFSIRYGSGAVAGTIVQDTVSMAGFSVPSQIFGAVTQLSSGVVSGAPSGLMGLAFAPLSQTGSSPFTEALFKANQLTEPLMGFYLTRFIDNLNAKAEEYGGQFTLGATNTSLYTGDIEYYTMPTALNSYWAIPLKQMAVGGTRYGIPATAASAAIDTGTTLIAGPTDAVAQIYGGIKGAAKGTGDLDGFWTYPCSAKVSLTMNFGGKDWAISDLDFKFGQVTQTQCVGAIFEIPISGSVIQWIVGDSFLKNVYSVYRFSPPSIGFAQLANSGTSTSVGGGGSSGSSGVGSTGTGASSPAATNGATRAKAGLLAAVPAMAMMLL